jgi:hypothetical protein
MDQFTTDINNALNDTNILPSTTLSKAKRRRKRIINTKIQKQQISDSTDHIPHVISWWDENEQEKCENDDQMLTTSDETLQNIVNGALNIMLASSKTTIQNRIKTFADRKVLTGNRRNWISKVNTFADGLSSNYPNKIGRTNQRRWMCVKTNHLKHYERN